MIIVKTPLRISLAGGGTDIKPWYSQYGAIFLSATINKYIYTSLARSAYNPRIRLRYSKMEEVSEAYELKNEIARETIQQYLLGGGVEITTHAEIPAATGLGSSGAFGVSLLHVLNPTWNAATLAEQATRIQMDVLGYPVGKQDQYTAAYGGVGLYAIDFDGDVTVSPFMNTGTWKKLQEKLVMFYTGITRDTNEVLRESTLDGLSTVAEVGGKMIEALGKEQFDIYGALLDEHWAAKKKRGKLSSPQIDEWYEKAKENGALGGKLVGAGGGGHLLCYTNDRQRLIDAMPLKEEEFEFAFEGSKVFEI